MGFISSVVASVIAGCLLLLLGGVLSTRARWVLTATLGRVLDIDTEYVFRHKNDSLADIEREIERASFVHLMTGRGNDLQRETFSSLLNLNRRKGDSVEFRILLPATDPSGGGTNWTARREAELARFDPAFGKGVLQDQIEMTKRFLAPYIDNGAIKVRTYDMPHIARILITDRVAYLTPYEMGSHGRNSPVIKYRRGGIMYDWLARLFEQLWNC